MNREFKFVNKQDNYIEIDLKFNTDRTLKLEKTHHIPKGNYYWPIKSNLHV